VVAQVGKGISKEWNSSLQASGINQTEQPSPKTVKKAIEKLDNTFATQEYV
jgi:hypothetical protein